MVRLVRLTKLYKYAALLTGKKAVEDKDAPKESRVGAVVSELTNRRYWYLLQRKVMT
jgi:hypothetical protein